MIRRLDFTAFKAIYRERIRADFPRSERRPLYALRRLYARGKYTCLALEEEGKIAAYAGFLHRENVGSVLLDYFAVERGGRGRGTGSRFLAQLGPHWPDRDGIIIECERPESAETEAERVERQRRISFYLRGGAELTPLDWRAFGVSYNVLWLPIRRSAREADVPGDLLTLYAGNLPAALTSRLLQLK